VQRDVDERRVGFANDEASAELIAQALRARGIVARVARDDALVAELPSGGGGYVVLVPATRAARARRILTRASR
jgi:hypothetical protein